MFDLDSRIDSLVTAALMHVNTVGNKAVAAVSHHVHNQQGDTRLENIMPKRRTLPEAQEMARALKKEHNTISQQVKDEMQNKAPKETEAQPLQQAQANLGVGSSAVRLHEAQVPALEFATVTAALQAQFTAQLHAKDEETKAAMVEMQTTFENQMAMQQGQFAEMLQMMQGLAQQNEGLQAKVITNETTITELKGQKENLQKEVLGLRTEKEKLNTKVILLDLDNQAQAKTIEKIKNSLPKKNDADYVVSGNGMAQAFASQSKNTQHQQVNIREISAITNRINNLSELSNVNDERIAKLEEQRNDQNNGSKPISGNALNRYLRTKSSASLNKGKNA